MSLVWRPVCDLQLLRLRAQLLTDIRRFFAERQVLEVETPLLCQATGTDPQLDFFTANLQLGEPQTPLFLQTSPEFAMKRLLAAGSGSIYQVCKAFRNAESGRMHNPEFTILEWYRLDFTLQQLMDEVAVLLQILLRRDAAELPIRRISYQQLFGELTGLDPLVCDLAAYRQFAVARGWPEAVAICAAEHDLWLDFLFSHAVQPALAAEVVYLVHGYPAVLSSLARLDSTDGRLTERFEVFVQRMEIGNGFFELADPVEQAARFDREIRYRQLHGRSPVKKDLRLLAALQSGLPDCSGVALGVDRLLMAMAGCSHINQVLAFPVADA